MLGSTVSQKHMRLMFFTSPVNGINVLADWCIFPNMPNYYFKTDLVFTAYKGIFYHGVPLTFGPTVC